MKQTFFVCCDTGCRLNGSEAVADALELEIAAQGADAAVERSVKRTGCHGECERGPMVRLEPNGTTYYKVKPEHAKELVAAAMAGEVVEKLLYKDADGHFHTRREDNPFFAGQVKIALRNVGEIDPGSIDDYIARGGYEALKKALVMDPMDIIEIVEGANLRGRGGAGFPTGRKWRLARKTETSGLKYVLCNGDEGDPGAFMDRSILEGDPHSVLEGLAIAALAVGAQEGYLYIRDEYASARHRIEEALKQAQERGFLGDNILGSGNNIHLSVFRGGGAFVCGEETALMASMEGLVGEPRPRPPYPAEKGLFDRPSCLNNVETLATVPVVLAKGAEEFRKVGTEKSAGTKVFALVGKVKHTGLVEIPLGTTLRQLVMEIGGGVGEGHTFKAIQIGGPSGGCLSEAQLDAPIDFDTLQAHGAIMGSGGIIVMDEQSCMVEVARYYVDFLCGESCGKCVPCREGLRTLKRILTDICAGRGEEGDIELMEQICDAMQTASLCTLGKTAANPVLSTIRYFREEYEAHIREKRCPAGVCSALTRFAIDPEACKACGACEKACPVQAISGDKQQGYTVDPAKCIACGSCRNACKFGAVVTCGKGE